MRESEWTREMHERTLARTLLESVSGTESEIHSGIDAELHEKNDEVKVMTQQLWQAAKLASVGELAASIAHELNNPLAIVSLRQTRPLHKQLIAESGHSVAQWPLFPSTNVHVQPEVLQKTRVSVLT